jgi:NADPH:quinone reductase-like Zn-dependent oxidoreductase
VALAPKNINLQDDAAIPSGAMTAWQGLFDHGKLQSGQRVLIHLILYMHSALLFYM